MAIKKIVSLANIGKGFELNVGTSKINVAPSAVAGNVLVYGADNLLYSPATSGPTGPTGPIGANGPAGPIGANGPAGPIGSTGAIGPTGLAGLAGPTGPAGPTGATG